MQFYYVQFCVMKGVSSRHCKAVVLGKCRHLDINTCAHQTLYSMQAAACRLAFTYVKHSGACLNSVSWLQQVKEIILYQCKTLVDTAIAEIHLHVDKRKCLISQQPQLCSQSPFAVCTGRALQDTQLQQNTHQITTDTWAIGWGTVFTQTDS